MINLSPFWPLKVLLNGLGVLFNMSSSSFGHIQHITYYGSMLKQAAIRGRLGQEREISLLFKVLY